MDKVQELSELSSARSMRRKVGMMSCSSSLTVGDPAKRWDEASAWSFTAPFFYFMDKLNSARRNRHLVNRPEGSVMFNSQFNEFFSVLTVYCSYKRYGRRVWIAQTTADHSRSEVE